MFHGSISAIALWGVCPQTSPPLEAKFCPKQPYVLNPVSPGVFWDLLPSGFAGFLHSYLRERLPLGAPWRQGLCSAPRQQWGSVSRTTFRKRALETRQSLQMKAISPRAYFPPCSPREGGREPSASPEGAAPLPGDDSTVGNHPSPSDGCGKGVRAVPSPFQLSRREPGSKKYQFQRQSLGSWINHSPLGRSAEGLRRVPIVSCFSCTGDAVAAEGEGRTERHQQSHGSRLPA